MYSPGRNSATLLALLHAGRLAGGAGGSVGAGWFGSASGTASAAQAGVTLPVQAPTAEGVAPPVIMSCAAVLSMVESEITPPWMATCLLLCPYVWPVSAAEVLSVSTALPGLL